MSFCRVFRREKNNKTPKVLLNSLIEKVIASTEVKFHQLVG